MFVIESAYICVLHPILDEHILYVNLVKIQITLNGGGWRIYNHANLLQFQVKSPTGTELGNIHFQILEIKHFPDLFQFQYNKLHLKMFAQVKYI